MLINLTNHHFSQWNETQKQAAKIRFGSVEDLTFPDISPYDDSESIDLLTDEFLKKCNSLLQNNSKSENAVLIMGEMTFCYSLINKLKNHDIRCIAATSVRQVINISDSERQIKFEFIKFREY
jgi:hypothetical protein